MHVRDRAPRRPAGEPARALGAGYVPLERLGYLPMTAPAPRMTSIYAGRIAIGFTIDRGKLGTEAFTTDLRSLGFFKDVPTAANAIESAITEASS
jgi:hypothetical protein